MQISIQVSVMPAYSLLQTLVIGDITYQRYYSQKKDLECKYLVSYMLQKQLPDS